MLLKKGSKGDAVKQLQTLLGCRPDGDFGPTTERMVKEWQSKHGLVADGIVGDKTWAALVANTKPQDNAISPLVVYNPIKTHITRLDKRTIKYLVIHFTAGSSSAGDSETKTRNVFLNRNASADFVVDDEDRKSVV